MAHAVSRQGAETAAPRTIRCRDPSRWTVDSTSRQDLLVVRVGHGFRAGQERSRNGSYATSCQARARHWPRVTRGPGAHRQARREHPSAPRIWPRAGTEEGRGGRDAAPNWGRVAGVSGAAERDRRGTQHRMLRGTGVVSPDTALSQRGGSISRGAPRWRRVPFRGSRRPLEWVRPNSQVRPSFVIAWCRDDDHGGRARVVPLGRRGGTGPRASGPAG